MTHERDIERLLDHWFTDGPTQAPDRVIDVVADRIGRQTQRPAWRLDWRHTHMTPTIKLGAGIAVVAIVSVVGFAFLRSQPDSGVATPSAPISTPLPTSKPSTVPSPSIDSLWWKHGTCGACLGPLAAGTYSAVASSPHLTYTVPPGWVNAYDNEDGVELLPDDPANRAHFTSDSGALQVIQVLRNHVAVAAADCTDAPEPGIDHTASAIVGALAGRDGVVASKPKAVAIGGLTGLQVDLSVADGWTQTCPGSDGTPQVPLFRIAGSVHWMAQPGERYRFIVLDVPEALGGEVVFINMTTSDASAFEAFIAAATPVVQSFGFGTTP